MNKRIRKKRRKQKEVLKPDLQTAWNVVAEHLLADRDHTFFIDSPIMRNDGEYDIHCVGPERVIIESTLNKK